MAVLQITVCALFLVTAAMSKPISLRSLSEDEDSSKSSESSESNSSEEAVSPIGPLEDPLQPAITDTHMPNTVGDNNTRDTTALLPSADSGPSPATYNTSSLPDLGDPQTSTDPDALKLIPDDPSQIALGVDISRDMHDPAQDSIHADTVHVLPDVEVSPHPGITETGVIINIGGTTQPQVTTTTTYQGSHKAATPPFSPHVIKPTFPPFSTSPPLPIPISTTLTGVPVCFTFQFGTPEPDPPRGDSI